MTLWLFRLVELEEQVTLMRAQLKTSEIYIAKLEAQLQKHCITLPKKAAEAIE